MINQNTAPNFERVYNVNENQTESLSIYSEQKTPNGIQTLQRSSFEEIFLSLANLDEKSRRVCEDRRNKNSNKKQNGCLTRGSCLRSPVDRQKFR